MDERDQSTGETEGELSPHDPHAHGGAPSRAAVSPDRPAPDAAEGVDADEDRADEAIAGHIGPRHEAPSDDGTSDDGTSDDGANDDGPGDEPVAAGHVPDDADETDQAEEAPEPVAEEPEEPAAAKLDWYILKVQSNREDSIADALQRRIKIAGLDRFFDEVIVPIEKVSEFKNGKKRVVKRKLYPGYIVVHMELNDDTWFLVRETPGIGDFTGSGGKPTPMLPHEVNKIVSKQEEKSEEQAVIDVKFKPGDRVRINEGTFENFEGDVDNIDMANGRVTVMINIFGRSTPVELEYWQVEGV
ncbi:MAG TPA: transcription termination/antitermination protein NusG [Pirellulales bacterium]|nr:transcription termination/antitermination protein NusG [Pirellulales bacterium]